MKTTRSENAARPFASIGDKIEPPPSAEGKTIARPRLSLSRPHGLPDCCVTTLIAPAGYGKSTLLRQWKSELDEKKIPSGWFNFDEGDNDPAYFLEYWIACLQKLDPRLGLSAQALLQSDFGADVAPIARSLLEDLHRWNQPAYLLLDDLHFVTNSKTQRLISDFIQRSPANLKFVLASRTPPTLLPACPRARGKHRIVDAKALAFDLSETASLIEESNRLRLPEGLVEIVRCKTGGWAAVLRLVSLALKQEQEMEDFSLRLSGQNGGRAQVIRYADYAGASRGEPKTLSPQLEEALKSILDKMQIRVALAKGETAPVSSASANPVTLIEPLTRREREILKAIHSSRDYPDVAKSLFVSMHTLKWHLKNIYGKLGVRNRTGAVVKGKVLGLID